MSLNSRHAPLALFALLAGCHVEPQAASSPAVSPPVASPVVSSSATVPSANSAASSSSASASSDLAKQLFALPLETLEGKPASLSTYQGKAILLVNTASECGYTPQYKGLEALYEQYKERGLVVLGFPCNDFGAQEPGDAHQIRSFCEVHYGVTFPLFAKLHAKGPEKSPLYALLTEKSPFPGEVKWNFTKFLVSPKGEVVARFESKIEPDAPELTKAVEANLPR